MTDIDPKKIIRSNERQIKKLNKKVKAKKAELDAINDRNQEEIERLKYEAENLKQQLRKKEKFLAQRRKDWEADGCPPFDPNTDGQMECIANVFCSVPDGKKVLIDYGDKPYIKPPFEWSIK